MRYTFILPGDTFKSVYETFNMHKDMVYKVSHVFNDKGKLRIFISDKNGNDVEYQECLFDRTSKTVSASEERQKRARLDFYWDNPDTSFVINPSYHYNFDTTEFFELSSKGHFGGQYEGLIGIISRHKKERSKEGGWKHLIVEGSNGRFKTKQDYYDYFKKIDVEDIRINGLHYGPQTAIDHIQFMLTIPTFDVSLLNLPEDLTNINIDRYVHTNKPNLGEFLKLAANVIFDVDELSDDNKRIIYNIIEAYELLPNSYGPTSVSKLLLGKEKKEISSVKHLSGTCVTLKQPQLFVLCDIVESFMYINGIFVKKDNYDEKEWLGSYEFIGTKMINSVELTKLKNMLL